MEETRKKQADNAQQACIEILEDNPRNVRALHMLGVLKFDQGDVEKGIELVEESLRISPDSHAYNDLGQMWGKLQILNLAKKCFYNAIKYGEQNPYAYNNLAKIIETEGDLKKASYLFSQAVNHAPDILLFKENLIEVLLKDKQHGVAIDLLHHLDSNSPNRHRHKYLLGMANDQLGEFKVAASFYQQCLELEPAYVPALTSLLNIPDEFDQEIIARSTKIMDSGKLTLANQTILGHALGKALDYKKEYSRALRYHEIANKAQLQRNGSPDFNILRSSFTNIKAAFTANSARRLKQSGNTTDAPVFILGLPRTGSSMIEQILASHPSVYGAGELQTVPIAVKQFFPNLSDEKMSWSSFFDSAAAEKAVVKFAQFYESELRSQTKGNEIRIIDKFPPNFIYLGLLAIAFPNAKFIHSVRNPEDVALSCFSNTFRMEQDYTNSSEDFAKYYHLYSDLMSHWHSLFAERILDIKYEQIIEDPKVQISRMVTHLDLPWDDACLSFYKTKRVVRTPSQWQVKQKLYKSSRGRARNYPAFTQSLKSFMA